jgi:predicted nucleic acid-binding protein
MSDVVLFDTSVFVNELRTGPHQERIQSTSALIPTATKAAERKFRQTLARKDSILTPAENNWLESGAILGRIHAACGFARNKLRDLHFDGLIALTTRFLGARLITTNRADFE